MNSTHIHLLLNHFPVIGTLIGSCLLAWGIIKNQQNIKASAAVLLLAMALVAVPVFLTGEPAEESVEKLPGVLESMIEQHEDAANIAIWLMGLTGIASFIALFLNRTKKQWANTGFTFVLILSALCFLAMARTGYYGGQIRHSEISGNIGAVQKSDHEEMNQEKDDD